MLQDVPTAVAVRTSSTSSGPAIGLRRSPSGTRPAWSSSVRPSRAG